MNATAPLVLSFLALASLAPAQSSAPRGLAAEEAAPRVPAVVEHRGDAGLRDLLIRTQEVWHDAGSFLVGALQPAALEGLARRGIPARSLSTLLASDELFLVDLAHEGVRREVDAAGRVLFQSGSQALVAVPGGLESYPEELQPGRTCHGHHTWIRRRAMKAGKPFAFRGLAGGGSQALGSADPRVQALVNAVDKANIEATLVSLQSNYSRNSTVAAYVDAARDQIRNKLVGFGYAPPTFQPFLSNHGDNVVLHISGAVNPGKIVVLGAHYDSINQSGSSQPAPGADDNASGSASLIEIARVLKTAGPFENTFRLIWFAGEEYGLLGSDFNAQQSAAQGEDIVAMLNMDMNSYRATGDTRDCDFATNDTTASLTSFCDQTAALYVPAWASKSGVLTAGTSDHRSYFDAGFPAVFLFEDLQQYYPLIHTASDAYPTATTDFDLARMITQAVVATSATLAEPLDMTIAHVPLPDTTNAAGPYAVNAQVTSLTSATVASVTLYYSSNAGQSWTTQALSQNGSTWSGAIPSQGSPVTILYYLLAVDSQGSTEVLPEGADLGSPPFSFFVGTKTPIYVTGFEEANDNGWTHGQIATQDDWQRGTPAAKSGDPGAAYAGAKCWGNDLGASGWNGAYGSNVENWLRSPAVDCSAATAVMLEFRRWLTVEAGQFDQATIRVNGTVVWQNPASPDLVDTAWTHFSLDVSAQAAGNPSVQVEFRLKSDGGVALGGWNIDEFGLQSLGPGTGGCPQPSIYCTAKVSSSFCVPSIAYAGSPNLSAPASFSISTSQLEDNKNALTFFSTSGSNGAPFQGGFLCAKSPLYRLTVKNSGGGGACQGSVAYTLADLLAHPSGGGLVVAGQKVNCQTWGRDPSDPFTTSLSDGLEFTACP